jgi:hypothetical protein
VDFVLALTSRGRNKLTASERIAVSTLLLSLDVATCITGSGNDPNESRLREESEKLASFSLSKYLSNWA